ncbi:MAG: ATP-binding protein [Caulobacteraceae bacterium]
MFVQLAGELAFALGILEERVRRQAAEEARRDAEDRARESLAELARAARVVSLGAFAASLAHEVNQPIAAIMANGEAALRWLDKSPPNLAEVRAALMRITRDAERTAAVVGRTRGMLAKTLGQERALDVVRLVEETLQFTEAQQRRCQVRAEIAVTKGLPCVWADPVQIQQVLVNLITNAIDAMKSVTGRRRVLRATAVLSGDGHVMFSISDTGTGIGEAFANQVFEAPVHHQARWDRPWPAHLQVDRGGARREHPDAFQCPFRDDLQLQLASSSGTSRLRLSTMLWIVRQR